MTADDDVATRASQHGVVALLAEHDVGVRAAIQQVIAEPALQRVIAGLTQRRVVAIRAVQAVVPQTTRQRIVAIAAVERVTAIATLKNVVPLFAAYQIVAGAAVEQIVERRPFECVIAAAAMQSHRTREIGNGERIRGGSAGQLRFFQSEECVRLEADQRSIGKSEARIARLDQAIDAIATDNRVDSEIARELVIARTTIQSVGGRTADQRIVAVAAVERHAH